MTLDPSRLHEYFAEVASRATPLEWALQAGAIVAAFALGWSVAHLLCARVKLSPRWKFGEGDFERVAFPLSAFLFLWVAKFFLGRVQPVGMLEIAEALLLAWLAIRLAVYILGHVLPHGALLQRVVRIFAIIAWVVVALHIMGLLGDVIDAMDVVGVTVGKNKQRVTPLLALQAVGALALTITLALWLSRITETRLMAAQTVEMSTRIVLTKLVRVSALFLAVLIALPMVGIDITALSIFSGALGVGLGFGLQKIASNYVSGFIVLLDHSVRIGDIVTIDGRRGEVKAIETRYTVIRGNDGVESIIPNEKLITDSVNHHTYTDPKVSIVVNVSVSYESDVEKACALLLECAKRQTRVIAEPPAMAFVKQLADSGVDLTLTVWISDPGRGEADLRSGLLMDILRTFKAEGIDIPYPRRDVRLIATPATAEIPSGSST
ncbi:MAG TPA: mechanosensitive ion channel domain-containing protein [Usitatibacter sp.]|nr:mechanosensitive ion channel domain-containing protein [Usitatibacter sp.]